MHRKMKEAARPLNVKEDWEETVRQANEIRRKKEEVPFELLYNQKTAKLTEEEIAMREENLAARPYYNEDGIRAMLDAVCLRAVLDYRRPNGAATQSTGGKSIPLAEKRERMIRVRKECEDFFKSGLFSRLTGIHDPDRALDLIEDIPLAYISAMERK